MLVVGPKQRVAPSRGSAVTIGAYDGIHLGHRVLLDELRDRASSRGLETAVVTFDRHPATVVRPESAPLLLTDLDQRLELLAAAGIDRTVVVPFDEDRANESAEDFVSEVLVEELGAQLVVVGNDFHFGHGRKGNVEVLRDLGRSAGFEVAGVELRDVAGAPVSSTRIRGLLVAGHVEQAAALLGRAHQVRGTVVRGDGRGGSQLGFPTANVAVPPGIVMPAVGIYAGRYERPGGLMHDAAISFGRRPTFYEAASPLLEAFLLDFDGQLYGEPARVSFVARLHGERRFDSAAALVSQMEADVAQARRVLAEHRLLPSP